MKHFKLLLITLLLVACSKGDYDFEKKFDHSVSRVNHATLPGSNNFNKGLLTYYLPQNIGVLESNNISSVLISDHVKIFMGVNVSTVMSAKERELALSKEDFVVMKNFDLEGRTDTKKGTVYIEELSVNNYLIYIIVDDVFFLSSTRRSQITDTTEKMLQIAKSLDVDKTAIVAEFSNKETFSYEKEIIELFSDSIPEEGMIKDIIIEEAGD